MRFLKDFVVPIMYRFGLTATEGWRRFLPLLGAHFWRLVLYGLFYALLGVAAGVCVLLAIVFTCCIAGCLMIVPYIGSVVLLPVTVYFRNYSLVYLAQFGSEFDLLPHSGSAD